MGQIGSIIVNVCTGHHIKNPAITFVCFAIFLCVFFSVLISIYAINVVLWPTVPPCFPQSLMYIYIKTVFNNSVTGIISNKIFSLPCNYPSILLITKTKLVCLYRVDAQIPASWLGVTISL